MEKQCSECIYCKDNGIWLYCDNRKQKHKKVNESDKCKFFTPYADELIKEMSEEIINGVFRNYDKLKSRLKARQKNDL